MIKPIELENHNCQGYSEIFYQIITFELKENKLFLSELKQC